MANLLLDERVIITKYPLGNSLDHLQGSPQEIEQNYKLGLNSDNGAVDSSDPGPQKAISRLLYVLVGHEVALNLRSKTKTESIASELSTLARRVQNDKFNYEHYRALSRLVIEQAPDFDIWNAVLNLITTVSRVTPPRSLPISSDGATSIHSSASQPMRGSPTVTTTAKPITPPSTTTTSITINVPQTPWRKESSRI